MVEAILGQLENLARRVQIRRLQKIYPQATGLKIGRGFLWQHPGQPRGRILERYRARDGQVLTKLDTLDRIG